MRVRVFRRDGTAVAEDVSLVLVESETGVPVSVAWQRQAGQGLSAILASHAGEADFESVLRQLGLVTGRTPDRVDGQP